MNEDDMNMVTFGMKPTIEGDRVVLRPIVAGDAESMWRDSLNDESNRFTGTLEDLSRPVIDSWCATRGDHDDRLDLAVVDRATGEWAGEVVINEVDVHNRSCSFRIALSPSAQNRGLGTEATRLIVDYVFDVITDPVINRLELEVYAFNPRAIAVYEKVGFRREGTRREVLNWDGDYIDAIEMSIIRSDRSTAHDPH